MTTKPDIIDCVENDVRLARPTVAVKADHGSSLRSAVDLNCRACVGNEGYRDAIKNCPDHVCFFWAHRPYADTKTRPEGVIPTEAEYKTLCEESVTDAQREQGARLAALHHKKKGKKRKKSAKADAAQEAAEGLTDALDALDSL